VKIVLENSIVKVRLLKNDVNTNSISDDKSNPEDVVKYFSFVLELMLTAEVLLRGHKKLLRFVKYNSLFYCYKRSVLLFRVQSKRQLTWNRVTGDIIVYQG